MKHSFLLLCFACVVGLTYAQTPVQVNKALLTTNTAAWCGNCGVWGLDMEDYMISTLSTGGFMVTMHSAIDTNNFDWQLESQVAKDWASEVDYYQAFPLFGVNMVDRSFYAITSLDVYNNVSNAEAAYNATSVLASTGFSFNVSGDTIKVTTRTKFWQDASGTYAVGAYILEDSIWHSQSGYSGPPVGYAVHNNVLRASMASTSWGDQIVNGNVSAGTYLQKNFNYVVTDPTWRIPKLKVVVVLFQVNGGYVYVNGYDIPSAITPMPSSVNELNTVINSAEVFPNPAATNTNVALMLNEPEKVNIHIMDLAGRVVYSSGELSLPAGQTVYPISTTTLQNGAYTVTISSEKGNITRKLSILN